MSRFDVVERGVLELELREPLAFEAEEHGVGQQPLVQVEAGDGVGSTSPMSAVGSAGSGDPAPGSVVCGDGAGSHGAAASVDRELGAARRLQHAQAIGLGEHEVLAEPGEVLALGVGRRQEPPPRRRG